MNFKDYRHRASVRAAVITEESIALPPAAGIADPPIPFTRGEYAELRGGKLYGWSKEEFEATFEPRRAERQAKTRKKREKVKAADA